MTRYESINDWKAAETQRLDNIAHTLRLVRCLSFQNNLSESEIVVDSEIGLLLWGCNQAMQDYSDTPYVEDIGKAAFETGVVDGNKGRPYSRENISNEFLRLSQLGMIACDEENTARYLHRNFRPGNRSQWDRMPNGLWTLAKVQS